MMSDTIFALSTPNGRSGIAVVRVSGPQSISSLFDLAGKRLNPRHASTCWLRDPADGEKLDQAVVIFFPAPSSFTGEDIVEFQLHGSPAVFRRILQILGSMPDLRPAEAGEFTRRALLNGRLDLAQVEGLGDLLEAETEMQRRQAMRLMEGALSRKAERMRADLVRALAHVEATIDFSDDDVPEVLDPLVRRTLVSVIESIDAELESSRGAERLRDGFEVAIVGRPNVGKSTLINALINRDIALTSAIPGTTRDVIEARLDIGGLPVTLLDTAGLREAPEEIEELGVALARRRATSADLRLFLVDDRRDVPSLGVAAVEGDILVLAKADLRVLYEGLAVSGKSGFGLDRLLDRIAATLSERVSTGATLTRERQRVAIHRARVGTQSALSRVVAGESDNVLVAEDIRRALGALDALVGKTNVEAVLDVVFASFCLGK